VPPQIEPHYAGFAKNPAYSICFADGQDFSSGGI
jgi:hypothetical protein